MPFKYESSCEFHYPEGKYSPAIMLRVAAFLVLFALAFSSANEEWENFKKTYGKSYSNPVEAVQRRRIFEENVKIINQHNQEAKDGKHMFTMGINHFADRTEAEIKDMYSMKKMPGDGPDAIERYVHPDGATLSFYDNKNWSEEGCISPVNQQGSCNSCWSFACTGAIACHYKLKNKGKLVPLSEQQLVDCAKPKSTPNHDKCDIGWWPNDAFQYIIKTGGVISYDSFPYKSGDGSTYNCDESKFPPNKAASATIKSSKGIDSYDDLSLLSAIKFEGPVVVTVPIDYSFSYYDGGIFYRSGCPKHQPDHAVLAVGYGIDEETNNPYWIIRNSWGEGWGEKGYGKIYAGENNMCGISSSASFPVV